MRATTRENIIFYETYFFSIRKEKNVLDGFLFYGKNENKSQCEGMNMNEWMVVSFQIFKYFLVDCMIEYFWRWLQLVSGEKYVGDFISWASIDGIKSE